MKKYIYTIRIPLMLIVANSILFEFAYSTDSQRTILLLFNMFRIAIIYYAGWLVVTQHQNSLLNASLAGPILVFVDHVMMGGASTMIRDALKMSEEGIEASMVFGGIIISYLMFVPIYMLIGATGGYTARKYNA